MKQLLSICKRTSKHFQSILANTKHKYIMIGVEGGGCNGMKYFIEPVSVKNKYDEFVHIDNIPIVICSKSLMYIIGMNIEFKKSYMGESLQFHNPNAVSKCGCGETFSI